MEEEELQEDENFEGFEFEEPPEYEEESPKAKADDEDDAEKYSKKVQKRIDRMTYRFKTAEEEAKRERQEREKLAAENAELRRRMEEADATHEKAAHESTLNELRTKHESLKEKIQAAAANGDLETLTELQDEAADVRARMIVQENRVPVEKPPRKEPDPEPAPKAKPSEPDNDGPNEAAAAWIERNAWYNDPKNARYRNTAFDIQNELINEGYDLDDEMFEELDRRLTEEMPRVAQLRGTPKTDNEEQEEEEEETPQPQRRPRPSVSAPPRGNEGGNKPPANRLTKDDLKSMQKYGMNPNDPVARKAWLNRNNL